MDILKNKRGKPLDDLDQLKMMCALSGLDCYTVVSLDGVPICGLHNGTKPLVYTAVEWTS